MILCVMLNNFLNYMRSKVKEFRCADVITVDFTTTNKDAQFPITIYLTGVSKKKVYLRAQTKVK